VLSGLGEHVPECRPRPERAVADHELRAAKPATLHIPEHPRPALGRLAVAVLHGQQLLGGVLAHADHDQQAQLVVLPEPHPDMDAVDEQVRVAAEPEVALAEPIVVGLPLLTQPADRRGRQPGGVLAEQVLQRRPEVTRREPAQVQDRQHLGDLRRPPRVRRQDLRGEPDALARLLAGALVVHARRPNRHRARADRHLALASAPVANHQPTTVLVELVDEPSNVVVGLRAQPRRDHPASSFASQLIQRQHDLLARLRDRKRANIHHWRAFLSPPLGAGSVLINREGTPPRSRGHHRGRDGPSLLRARPAPRTDPSGRC
jgi:hypothetical protein